MIKIEVNKKSGLMITALSSVKVNLDKVKKEITDKLLVALCENLLKDKVVRKFMCKEMYSTPKVGAVSRIWKEISESFI